MLGRNIFIILAVLLVGTAANVLAAPSLITGLDVTRDGENTVVGIYGDGPVRIAHQSVEAKDGKPFRIVVDVLAARHSLAQKEFVQLPSSVVTALRTSQYSVKPEEIVRVVVDLARETVYRVETTASAVKIYLSDPQTAAFPKWSSTTAPAKSSPVAPSTVTVAAQTPSPAKTPVPSVTAAPVTVPETATKTPAVPTQQKIYAATTPPSPKSTVAAPAPSQTVTPAPVKKEAAAPAPTQTVAVAPVNKETAAPATTANREEASAAPLASTDLAKKTSLTAVLFGMMGESEKNVPAPGDNPSTQTPDIHKAALATTAQPPASNKQPSPTPVTPEPQKTPALPTPATSPAPEMKKSAPAPAEENPNTLPAVASPGNYPEEPPVASLDDGDVSPADLLPAVGQPSKYRQDAAKSMTMKQTQVVEFPKRFVTTYESIDDRDPFETLVDETRTTKGNMERRIPNVETLLLVGVLKSETGRAAALLEDLDGIGYILKPGDQVKNGFVAQIEDNAIYFQVNEYGWSRTIVKEMEKENSTRE